MLAGLGGRTIEQAKAAISWPEFHQWMAYRQKHGPLHLQQRMVDAAALLALTVANSVPRKSAAKFDDFVLYQVQAQEEGAVIDLETAMATWR